MVLTVLGMVAQMERRFIKERQRDGIEQAKGKGTYTGGKRRLDRRLNRARARVENLNKPYRTQLASNGTSCRSALTS